MGGRAPLGAEKASQTQAIKFFFRRNGEFLLSYRRYFFLKFADGWFERWLGVGLGLRFNL